jgi:hypothetical protein
MKNIEPCLNCKFLTEYGCKAYPDGIKDEFAQGIKIHTKVEEDQKGDFVFTPATDGE